MATYRITGPDGQQYDITAPDDATGEQVIARFQQQNGGANTANVPKVPREKTNQIAALAAGVGGGVGQAAMGLQDLAGMGIGWAGDLFAPARTPSSLSDGQGAPNWAQRAGKWLVDDAEYGRKKLAAELAPYKEDHPMTAAGGEMLGNALATLPVGGVLGKAVQVGGNAFKAGKFVSPLAEAISSGGMRASGLSTIPGMAVRATGGAISGGASSWLVDPESGVSGALFGAALPVAAPAAALAARVLPKHVLGMTTGTSAETIGAAFNAGKTKRNIFLKICAEWRQSMRR